MAPSSERHGHKSCKNTIPKSSESDLKVGDTVMLGESGKLEIGALVFNHKLMKFGIVITSPSNEESKLSDFSKRHVQLIDVDAKPVPLYEEHHDIWDVKSFVFLEEENKLTGKIISFDGPYAIVQIKEASSDSMYSSDALKVCIKTSLEKLSEDANISQSRYRKYLYFKPVQIFLNEKYTVAAVSCSESGISSLFVRSNDNHAFLTIPNCENSHSNWFTSGSIGVMKNKNVPYSTTVEFESVNANEANLCLKSNANKKLLECKNIQEGCKLDFKDDYKDALSKARTYEELESLVENQERLPKISRSLSMPVTSSSLKRKLNSNTSHSLCSKKFIKPKIYSFVGAASGTLSLLFDNKECFYPVRFDCCLREPPLFEIEPIISFALFEQSFVVSDESLLTIVAGKVFLQNDFFVCVILYCFFSS